MILILAAVLRLFYLGKTPLSLEWDEVALGYDAFSILKTGKDQFGNLLPLTFRSLDDYKPPLYVYTSVPLIAFFGLSEFSIRLTSALFGLGAVFLTYQLVLELFWQKQSQKKYFLALFSSLFLAISPWHLQFSRAAFETNLSVTITLAAVVFFLKGLRQKVKFFWLSAFFFGLALFSYHSTRVVTPLLFIFLLLIFHNNLPSKKNLFIFFAIYAIFICLFFPIAFSKQSQIRFQVTNILDIEKNQEEASKQILLDERQGALLAGKIFHNRRISFLNYENLQQVLANYLIHFSPKFLFVSGDVPLHHAPNFGMMYFFDLPLIVIGIVGYLFFYRDRRSLILPLWLLFGPVPASVTWQVPHAVRAEIILPTLQIFSAIGLIEIVSFIRREFFLKSIIITISYVFFSLIFIYGVGAYLHQYYIHTNYELSKNWLYGRKEAVLFTEKIKGDYDKVIVSLKVDMPHIFWLFYSKYPPEKYLAKGGTVSGGFAEEGNKFDKYEFRNFSKDDFQPVSGRNLLVGIPGEFPDHIKILKVIQYLDGTEAIRIGESTDIEKN